MCLAISRYGAVNWRGAETTVQRSGADFLYAGAEEGVMVLNAGPDVCVLRRRWWWKMRISIKGCIVRPRGGEGDWGVNTTHQAKDSDAARTPYPMV